MRFVEPIRDKKKIQKIKSFLIEKKKYRDLLLFVVWINSALRISDLLALRVWDLFDWAGLSREMFEVVESKTKKKRKIVVVDGVRDVLELYKTAYPSVVKNSQAFLFFNTRIDPLWSKNITRVNGWQLINGWCKKHCDSTKNYGGHTLRKTWWYHAWKGGIDVSLIQYCLNHSNLAITQRYLGITDDDLGEAMHSLNL